MPDGIPLSQWSGSDATNTLRESVERLAAESSKQTEAMLRLTKSTVALSVVMLGVGIVQVVVALVR